MFNWLINAIHRYNEFPKGIGPLTKAQAAKVVLEVSKDSRVRRWFISLDVAINELFLNGVTNETISSHIGRAAFNNKGWAIFFAKCLNLFEWNHVAQAIAADGARGRNIAALEDIYLAKDENG